MNGTTPKPHSWIDTLASKVNFDTFLKRFHITTAVVLETFSYFTVGVLLGIVVKRYLKQIIILVIALLVLIKTFEYMGVGAMTLNWIRIKALIGIGPQDTLDSVVRFYTLWVQTHVRHVVSLMIGLLVGIKLL